MTPKEKAIELVEKIDELLTYLESKSKAKDCALIAVEEIINIVPYEDNDKAKWISDEQTFRYWKEVKQEINKL